VLARPNGLGHARMGLVIGKRILPRAVDRNRVKRCARAGFRQIFAELPACDFVIRLLARPVAGTEVDALVLTLKRAARRACEAWPDSATPPIFLATHG